jgi:hypothetical protein
MHRVECPECHQTREVKARKPWMTGDEPYRQTCKSCCQVGKEKPEETRLKLSLSVSAAQTDELRQQKSDTQKALYESGQSNLIAGVGGGWNKGCELPSLSEETKAKIAEGVKKAKESNP